MSSTLDSRRPARRPALLVVTSTYPRWKDDYEPGFVHELTRRLVDRFDVIVLCPHAAGAAHVETLNGVEVLRYRYAPTRFETLVNDGGIVTNLRRARWKLFLLPGFILAQLLAMRRLLRRRDIAVVHAHWLLPQGVVCAVLNATTRRMPPFIATSHGSDLLALKGWLPRVLRRFVVRRAARITVVSSAMRDLIRDQALDPAKIEVMPMGTDLVGRFSRASSTEALSREIVFVGRLVEGKGLDVLLDAMPAVLARVRDARLSIIGGGPLHETLLRRVERLGIRASVSFHGAIANALLPDFYCRASIFVAPFTIEQGFGLTLVEASGCGCRLIVSDTASCREIVTALGAGTIVPRNDAAALANAIVDSLETSPDNGMQPGERQQRLLRYDWSEVASAYARVLEACIARSPARDATEPVP